MAIAVAGDTVTFLNEAGQREGAKVVVARNADGSATNSSPTETTSTPAAVALTANTAANLLAANANRIRVTIHNPLATTLFVRKATLAASAATVAAGGYDFIVPPGGVAVSAPGEWKGGLNGICATAGSVNVSEAV